MMHTKTASSLSILIFSCVSIVNSTSSDESAAVIITLCEEVTGIKVTAMYCVTDIVALTST